MGYVIWHGLFFAFMASDFSLLGQRKVTKRKATPTKLAFGFSALLGAERRRENSLRSDNSRRFIARPLRYSTAWMGMNSRRVAWC